MLAANGAISLAAPLRERSAAPRADILRVGLDLGCHTTVFQVASGLGDLLVPRTFRIPTWIAYGPEGAEGRTMHLGAEALRRRHQIELVNPLRTPRVDALADFARGLRALMDPEGKRELWGIVNCPQGATPEEQRVARCVAHQVFDRTLLLDASLLMATSFGSREAARGSIWIDAGARAVRVAPVHGAAPEAEEVAVIPGGGDAVSARLKEALNRRYPGLVVTDSTADVIKEKLAHVPPEERKSRIRVALRQRFTDLDVTANVRDACEPLVADILKGLQRVFDDCASDRVEDLAANIVLAGGCARMPGLAARIRLEACRAFVASAAVRTIEDPKVLVANGALRWAHLLDEEEWGIPIFGF